MRVDLALIALFPELTRAKIQSLIEKRKIQILTPTGQWRALQKPGEKFARDLKREDFQILEDDELHFVSRGALKLKKAVEEFALPVAGRTCLDVGLSTGGFSDYLLQRGARRILGIDVGKEQLHPRLRSDLRLTAVDKVNAKEALSPEMLASFFQEQPAVFDLIVIDVSFISLTKVVPNLVNYLAERGDFVALIKPQFELDKGALNKKGVVKDPEQIPLVVEKIIGVFQENKLKTKGYCPSPIEGENGNKEILIVAGKH